MGDILNLDAIQAAEAEKAGDGLSFTLGGDNFTLPGVLPIEFLLTAAGAGLKAAIDRVLGPDAVKFWSHSPGRDAVDALDEAIARHYGFGKWGNSSASAEPSTNGSAPSRPTFSATTA